MLAIEAQGLTKTYRGLWGRGFPALQGIDLSVESGRAFGLIGPNGAGKTTFIKLLLGVSRPTSGVVRVLGGDPQDPAIRARIGYLPERLHLPVAWTARAFLSGVASLKGVALPRGEVDRLLGRVGLSEDGGRKVGGFSKGMRQRLGLAAALIGKPELLVLDEPTDGVDPLGRIEVRKLLAEEVARGAALFLNSHLLAETERVCSRIGVLSNGRMVREGNLAALTQAGTRFQLRFAATPSVELMSALGLKPRGDAWIVSAESPAELNGVLDKLRAQGLLLTELGPDSRDLEEVLAESVVPDTRREVAA